MDCLKNSLFFFTVAFILSFNGLAVCITSFTRAAIHLMILVV